MEINKGEKIAIVGTSGSGKSTLLKLLMKFYQCESGSITMDGKDINSIKTDDYRNLIGYVPQESLLFSGTIAENIAWGMDDFNPEKIYKAAEEAQALEFIMNLPDKFKTVVGENGATLSGGERQRIALARILMRNPDRVYTRENLMNIVWGTDYPGDVRTVDVHIRRLREKIEADSGNPLYVHTKWGVGYYFLNKEK